ncbi:MORC family CW-type zinc finger protein 3-like isoform X2 [Chenopodium quinoa]|uniref:MORC family CW-type zinc finger protein 3-like isoform X2 n=1 Tax=Chenopodium quinoa TaxID=63459 RepID=UPI000B7819A5|nr:MORC family CW-type zinc finger protein 3-like isoform X2 [Chenopodium quinoa]
MMELKANFSAKKDASSCHIKLKKDGKFICYAKCTNSLIQQSSSWNVDIVKKKTVEGLLDLPTFSLFPSFMPVPEKNVTDQKSEWNRFLTFLYDNDKVATVKLENLKIHVFPSAREPNETDDGLYFSQAVVAYDLLELCDTSVDQGHATSVMCGATTKAVSSLPSTNPLSLSNSPHPSMKHVAFESGAYVKGSSSAEKATCSSISKCHEHNSLQLCSTKEDVAAERNFVTNPSYLKTLGHAHSGWIFGAIAELVDNSRDARASRLEIAVETIFDKTAGSEIPMLSVIDDGVGMNHQEILSMISFGHKVPDEDNQDCIGRFGVGFKTGSMRLGRDALVLTQTTHSRSVAFLSQSLNEGKDNVEIPVVSYRRQAQCMDIDTSVHSEALAKNNLNAIKQFSPFNEYLIGEKAGLFRGNTGTQIYIWNLDKWGAEYTLEWQAGLCGGSTFHQGDIYIRSRRVRKRPGQTSRKVSLDYSLRSYLEVIFLEPRMKIYVQGSLVRSRPLAKSLNNTAHHNGDIMGKQVRLTLGRCQIEWDEANCGIFLYWHGRLIEAYKRVGGMVHSADMGRGVIGVIDVTELMDDGNGGVWVHNNKQGFQDCEPYALLEEWLGKQADEYWDKFFDPVQLKKGHARYKPDNNWVQCDKCRKWRLLDADFDSMNLPKDWFCYMEPFNGKCEMPEEKPGRGVITVGLKRSSGHDPSKTADCQGLQIDSASPTAEVGEDKSTQSAEGDEKTPVKKARRGKGQDKSTPPAEDDEEIPVIKRRRRSVQNARKYIQE